ncbi:NAD-dependent epimerase/dehydratase family protein [Zhenpiania hominis]|uniref:NAD-dependent epimerase/dehydratase family protein n=1 Tax=Zhenpiania hominis TaxID=2763644 RepID=A0A923SSY4_9FIRM|nr:NAD-dependent epimerase/dehydratase family protein [Zhenpiania hominis]MBC6680849.1 NAD-dependent epimerase/dehydratase family protein [Zhenpiania hominis]
MSRIMEEDIKNILSADIQWEKLKSAAVLVTGASGMLGTYMLRTLAALNDSEHYDMKLYGLVRHPEKMPEDLKKRVSLITQSVSREIETDVRFDYIIHAASPASPLIMREDPAGTIAANTLGTYYTLELARKSNAKGYLFISSREIYGQPYEGQREFTEDTYGFVDPLEPRSCYPEGKKAAETMCSCFRQQYGMNTKIARLAHTFGPGMSIDDGRVQADFLRNVIRNEDIVLKSEGLAVRTYTYVSDAVAALFYILLNSQELVYNIASEESTVSIRELAQTLVDAYPERNLKLVFDLPKADENTGCAPFTLGILNSDKIRKLGWKPSYTLKEGLMRTVAYLEE